MGRTKSNSKCWTCTKFYNGCSWSRDFTPVKGWKADAVTIREKGHEDIESYIVKECPEYEKDSFRTSKGVLEYY